VTGGARGTTTDARDRARALAARHLDAIATVPRPAGGDAESRARAHCTAELRALGFTVREAPFEYSAFSGMWATPAGGALSIALLAIAGHQGGHGSPRAALGVLVAGGALLGAGALWMARRGVLAFPLMRRRGVNVEATRGDDVPALWLVAHLDSKSQPVPMAARVGGVVFSILAWLGALALGVLGATGAIGDAFTTWVAVTAIGGVAGLPIVASVVGERSAGAVDDASGAATVLAAAALLPRAARCGVLLTSAEELGMAGARAWAEQWRAARRAPGIALNVDGVDDAGSVQLMRSGGEGRAASALRDGARDAGVAATSRRLVPGILVDAVALADAGWDAATLSRGNLSTLALVHTPADARARLTGEGVVEGAIVLAAAAERILGER
jgi:hypothetical protein